MWIHLQHIFYVFYNFSHSLIKDIRNIVEARLYKKKEKKESIWSQELYHDVQMDHARNTNVLNLILCCIHQDYWLYTYNVYHHSIDRCSMDFILTLYNLRGNEYDKTGHAYFHFMSTKMLVLKFCTIVKDSFYNT